MSTWALATIAGLLVVFAAISGRLERSVLTPAIFFTTTGLMAGNDALGLIDLHVETDSVRALAEATLTLVLFADASRIDVRALRRELTVPLRLLGIGLPLTIVAGALFAVGVFGELALVEALVLAVVLAPTDAALSQAVVTDRRLPSRVRQGLNVESGLNDGLCVPLLFIALAIGETEEEGHSVASSVHVVVDEIGWGMVGGVAAGVIGALVVRHAVRRDLVDPTWLQIIPAAAALLAYGAAVALGGSGFIGAFVAGMVFGRMHRRDGGEVTYLVDEAGLVLGSFTFLLFGAVFLGKALGDATWQVFAVAVLSLSVVRMVPVALSLIGTHPKLPTVGYLGWFGPRGLASIVFAALIVEEADL